MSEPSTRARVGWQPIYFCVAAVLHSRRVLRIAGQLGRPGPASKGRPGSPSPTRVRRPRSSGQAAGWPSSARWQCRRTGVGPRFRTRSPCPGCSLWSPGSRCRSSRRTIRGTCLVAGPAPPPCHRGHLGRVRLTRRHRKRPLLVAPNSQGQWWYCKILRRRECRSLVVPAYTVGRW